MRKTADQTKLGHSLQNTWPVLFNTVKKKQEKSKKLSQAKKAKAMWRACPSVHGVLQARILEWIAMPSSRGPSQPRDPVLQADSLPSELPGKPPGDAVTKCYVSLMEFWK